MAAMTFSSRLAPATVPDVSRRMSPDAMMSPRNRPPKLPAGRLVRLPVDYRTDEPFRRHFRPLQASVRVYPLAPVVSGRGHCGASPKALHRDADPFGPVTSAENLQEPAVESRRRPYPGPVPEKPQHPSVQFASVNPPRGYGPREFGCPRSRRRRLYALLLEVSVPYGDRERHPPSRSLPAERHRLGRGGRAGKPDAGRRQGREALYDRLQRKKSQTLAREPPAGGTGRSRI
jgi:hypothetical protein